MTVRIWCLAINAQTKSVIPEAKLEHSLEFITGSHVILDLPFGAKDNNVVN